MTTSTSAGATLGITATAPATFDKAGYTAGVFTPIGEITNLGDFGREYSKVEHKPLATRGTVKFKGGFDEGQLALTIGLDEDDAGQMLLETAAGSDANYYFCLTRQTGDKYYFPAQVMSFKRQVGERDSITSVSVSLEITQINGVGVVKALVGG
jgi:hypothetical protein